MKVTSPDEQILNQFATNDKIHTKTLPEAQRTQAIESKT